MAERDPVHPTELAVVTVEQLRAVVREAVACELAERAAAHVVAPELVDGRALTAMLSVSRTTLHRLRVAGMPAVPVGDTFRYRPSAVLAWLESGRGGEVSENTRLPLAETNSHGAELGHAEQETSRSDGRPLTRARAPVAAPRGGRAKGAA
jgi:hypothetical protein